MPDAQNIRTVLFDLDGTLIDHFTAIYRCYKFAQETLGLPAATYDTVRATVGGSVPVTMARLVGQSQAEEATRLFREHFEDIMFEDLHLLPSAEWLLSELHQKGLKLAVFTNKSGIPSRKIMSHLKLDHYLVDTIGSLDTEWKKPEPEFTRYALDKVGADPATTILIGDSPFDIEAAKAGGLPTYVIATGSHTEEQLRANDPAPDGVFPTLLELGEEIFGLKTPQSCS